MDGTELRVPQVSGTDNEGEGGAQSQITKSASSATDGGAGAHSHTFPINATVAGTYTADGLTIKVNETDFANSPFDNRPPYYVLAFIIRIDAGQNFSGSYTIPVTAP